MNMLHERKQRLQEPPSSWLKELNTHSLQHQENEDRSKAHLTKAEEDLQALQDINNELMKIRQSKMNLNSSWSRY